MTPTHPRRPWLRHAHLALTAALLLAVTGVAVLAGTGRLRYAAGVAAAPTPATSDGPPAPPLKQGRYRIEPIEDARRLLETIGPGGALGLEYHHAWVFRYKGGLLECRLESDLDGATVSSTPLPSNWPARLRRDDRLSLDAAASFRTEGYILATTRKPHVPYELDPLSYTAHLGGLFGAGPAGPLHQLATLHLEARSPQVVRLFVSVNPPAEGQGVGFNAFRDDLLMVRFPLVPAAPPAETQRLGQGTDLGAGQDVLLLDWRRGPATARLVARFLPDAEVARFAAAGP